MGCWNETCMASRLPIYHGDPIVFVPIAQRVPRMDACFPDGAFVPVTAPIPGEYDDYGGIESVPDGTFGAKILRRCRFFASDGDAAAPLDLAGTRDETAVRNLVDAIRSRHVYLEHVDPVHGRRPMPVHVAFIHKRFVDLAMEETKHHYVPDDVASDVSFRYRQVGALADYLGNAACPKDGRPGRCDPAVRDLARLQAYLGMVRVAWAPSTGTGSQAGTDGTVLGFHRAVLEMAEEQARAWDE